jgi:hypothetical protein
MNMFALNNYIFQRKSMASKIKKLDQLCKGLNAFVRGTRNNYVWYIRLYR